MVLPSSSEAYWKFIRVNEIEDKLKEALDSMDADFSANNDSPVSEASTALKFFISSKRDNYCTNYSLHYMLFPE
jgi:hypothetical protein